MEYRLYLARHHGFSFDQPLLLSDQSSKVACFRVFLNGSATAEYGENGGMGCSGVRYVPQRALNVLRRHYLRLSVGYNNH